MAGEWVIGRGGPRYAAGMPSMNSRRKWRWKREGKKGLLSFHSSLFRRPVTRPGRYSDRQKQRECTERKTDTHPDILISPLPTSSCIYRPKIGSRPDTVSQEERVQRGHRVIRMRRWHKRAPSSILLFSIINPEPIFSLEHLCVSNMLNCRIMFLNLDEGRKLCSSTARFLHAELGIFLLI